MSAIAHKLIVDQDGHAQEVVLSIETFRHIEEVLGADLDDEELSELHEAIHDSLSGNRSAFVSLDDI